MSDSTGFRKRLEARLARFDLKLDDLQLAMLERYFGILNRWNAKINLTSLQLRDAPAEALDRLFVEPILAADFVEDAPFQWFDLGSGSGSPAIPFKIVRPAAELTLVESIAKKAAFLREAAHLVGLRGVRVLATRIEDLPALVPAQSVDLITIRAVKIDSAVLEAMSRLLNPHGRLLLFGVESQSNAPGFVTIAKHPLTKPGDQLVVLQRES